jgi:amino acid adenylation domain-containing protein
MKTIAERIAALSLEQRALLAREMEEACLDAGEVGIFPRDPSSGPAALSYAQQRLWFMDRMEPGSPLYNMPAAWRLRGALDHDALQAALSGVAARHESLRTVFGVADGEPVQVVLPAAPFVLPCTDLSALSEDERQAQADARVRAAAQAPFDLERGPLFRAELVRLADDEHLLLVCMHHIVSDGWSLGVLFGEVASLYGAALRGEPCALARLPIQYADFAAWQREHLAGARLDQQVGWWREHLAGAPALLELPTDHPRPAVRSHRGGLHHFTLPAPLAEELNALARREGATLYMVLLAAFQVLLGRYSGGDDVVVGSPVAGRTRPELEGLIGFFINTIAVRGDLSGDPSFRELLRRVREATLGAFAHQDVPFEKLVEEIAPERSLSYNPLFQSFFVLQNGSRDGLRLPGLEAESVHVEGLTAKFDLLLAMWEGAEGVGGVIEYAADLFGPATVERMADHFRALLGALARNPERRLSALPLVDEVERGRLLAEWSVSGDAPPAPRTVHAAVEAIVASRPDAGALAWGSERLTYGELNARANRLARHLRRCGVAAETRVGVLLDRTLELPVALLAVLKAGGTYVPLDPAFPPERLAYILGDAEASLLLTREGLRSRVEVALDVVSVDGDAARIADEDGSDLASLVGPEHLAYVIYTSGSTGEPKGSMVPHRAIPGYAGSYLDLPADAGPETWLHYASLSWDVPTLEIWTALLRGARCVLFDAGEEGGISVEALGREIARQGVTTLWMTSSLLNAVLDGTPEILQPLSVLLAGGEALSPAHVRRAIERFPALRLVNGYGPSECTVFSTCRVLSADLPAGPVPIGRPVGDRRVYVLDAAMEPSPAGVPGELFVGGPAVARGYLGRARLTAEKFVPDAFSAEPGARLYRTGDRVRWLGSGELEYVGRMDQQVKVRGFRIEPGEIEAALLGHPGVREATAGVHVDAAGEKRLVAWFVPEGEAPVAAELRDALRANLPEYMVPSAFVALESMPLTRNGKVNRAALPAPHGAEEEEYVAPRTPAEAEIAAVWAEVLGVERVGVTDDFFALGGHSLRATRVVARLRQQLGIEVPVRLVFESPTVEGMARAAAALADAGAAASGRIPRRAREDGSGEPPAFPLSYSQQRLWFLDRMQPGTSLYNVPAAWRLRGALDCGALAAALSEVVRRHESLRTVFRMAGGEPVQVVLPAAPVALGDTDLSALPQAVCEARAAGRLRESARAPFDLQHGPLFHAELVKVADDEHLLLLSMHHIVSDGWSLGVLFGEIAALYTAFAAGRLSPLAEPALQYGDYAAWQREHLTGERLERQVAWWSEHLSGAPTLLELPTDRPRPAVQTYRGGLHHFRLPAELAEQVDALARHEGATPYMVLLAAFQVLLGKYARQDDVVVGSPITNRGQAELEGLIGFFVNTIAVRGDLSGDPTFRELLGRVRESTLGAYAHQEVPFEKLVEELAPERSLSHNPLFQTFFAVQNGGGEGLSLTGLQAEPMAAEGLTAKFDLSLFLWQDANGMGGAVEYAADLFEPASMERLAGHFRVLLEGVVSGPDRRLSALPLLADEERARVLDAWSGAGQSFAAEGTLHGRFEAQATQRPNAVALTCEGESLGYAALNARANRLARRLRALGVGPESRVGLCAERSADLVAGVLAILKAGGAYVPLDPAYPADRLAYMAADSGVRVVLAQAHLADRVPAGAFRVVALEEDLSAESGEDLNVAADAAQLAYVIYTSGSTGRPKGVGVTHANVLRLFTATDAWFGFGATDVWTLFHSYAFDFSVWELWGALLYGGRLVVVPWEVSRSPEAFRALLAAERVTVLNQTPSAFRALAQADAGAAEPLETLRYVVFGGEALVYEGLRDWLDRYGPARPRLVNMYGITETTVHVTYHPVTGAELRAPGLGSGVGVPIPDLRACVLDAHGQPLPVGVPGELCVGGAGPARGYLGRPALTAEKFVPDALSGAAGARLYRSGDLARWTADGELEYLGRIDQQVKVRGFRIELGEIEAVLLAQPQVAEAAVIVRGAGEDAALAAYVVPAADTVDASALREALKKHLPEYMVPGAVVVMERLPLTSNGKLDRAALPEPDASVSAQGDAAEAPCTPTEELLAGIWAEVLRAGRVGATDDFFELGGHSLRATQVMARVQEAFGVAVPLRALFEHPTVRALAARVDAARRDGTGPAAAPLVAVDRDGPLPLSFAQQRLWFLDSMQPGTSTYNIPAVLDLSGALDVPALERALGEVVRRHEALRTVFALADGAPVQVVAPPAAFALRVTDLGALSADERAAETERRTAAEARRPFDLAAGPLFRAELLRLGADEHRLLLTLHHIVSDGWSHAVLFRELRALYEAFVRGEPSPLAEPGVQYGDFAAWQRAHLSGERMDASMDWWRERLAGVPASLRLPTDHPRPPVPSQRGAGHAFQVPVETAAALRALARREGATLYMVLLAAFQVLLGRYTRQDDVVVGTPIAGRVRPELEGLIGFFINTLALRTDLSGDPSFRDLLARVRETTLDAYAHQDVPFEKLVEELAPERSLSRTPLFQVMFALQNAPAAEARLGDVRVRLVWSDPGQAHFDLIVGLEESGDELRGGIRYAADLFDAATVERMAGHFRVLLAALAQDPERPLSALPVLGDEERERLLSEWSVSGDAVDSGRTVHAAVEAIAAARPGAEAVVCGSERLTYGELNARANRLARHLRRRGVGPEARVGVLLERTLELPVALLAVLKAGAAYVPLDPSFPPERLGFILADAQAPVLLTREALSGRVEAALAVVFVDGDAARIEREDASDLEPVVGPDHLAYVIYTSGSTGEPKGSMIPHRAVPGYAGPYLDLPAGAEAETWLQYSSLSWDALTLELWTPLLRGARCVLFEAARDGGIGIEALGREIAAQRVTTLWMTASLFNAVLESAPDALEPLRVLMTGGEALSQPHVRRALERYPRLRLVNGYGPSECTVFSSCRVLTSELAAGPVPIGRPVGDRRVYVLDGSLQLAPAGIPGELYVGGPAVARGYLGRAGLTAEKFVPDAFGVPGARLYRTGDRVRWLGSGELEFVGREDQQVKVRGFRIEPGEVEAALLAQPGVREVTVGIHEDAAGEKRLVAWFVPEGEAPAAAELRDALRAGMPEYMVPSAFVVLESMPLTRNAKVNRAALPEPQDGGEEEYVAPRNEGEAEIAAIWAEVLGVERVGVRDDFFALGGHSLRATRVVARLQQQLGIEIPVRVVFESPTVEAMARAAAALVRSGAPAAETGGIVRADRGARRARLADLPLSTLS